MQAFETAVGEPRAIVVAGYEPAPQALKRRRRASRSIPRLYRDIVRRALAEDIGDGDITTDATVAAAISGRAASFLVKADCVLAGLDVALEAFRQLDPGVARRRRASATATAARPARRSPRSSARRARC